MRTTPPVSALTRGIELHRSGHPREALAWLLKAVSREPNRADVWVAAGLALLDAGDPVQAEASLRRAASLAPQALEVRAPVHTRSVGRADRYAPWMGAQSPQA